MYNRLENGNNGAVKGPSTMDFKDIDLLEHPLVTKAFEVASEAHAGESRGTSYHKHRNVIFHPAKVAELLQHTIDEYDPELIAAAMVHDVKEDTDMTIQDLENQLGSEVAYLVDEVSVDTNLKGVARREFQIASIDDMSWNARRLKVADCTINLLNMAFDPPAHWSVENRVNYLESRRRIIDSAGITDTKLLDAAHDALEIAERATFVAVRQRAQEKGFSGKTWSKAIRSAGKPLEAMLERAKMDIERLRGAFDEDGLPIQPDKTLDAVYSAAPQVHKEISTVLKRMSHMYGYEAIIPDKLKERARADEVVETRFQDDASRITDVARGAIICKTMEDVHFVMHCLSQSYKNMVIKDRFTDPPMTAYRDMCVVVRTDNNRFAEIQIHLESFWNAKKHEGDKLYAQIRDIAADAQGRDLTPEEKKAKRKLYDQTRKLYKAAAEPHNFESNDPSTAPSIRYPEFVARAIGAVLPLKVATLPAVGGAADKPAGVRPA